MVTVNVAENNDLNPSSSTWEVAYPPQLTAVRNIYFFNSNENIYLRGILFAGRVEISSCFWEGFIQAVASCSSVYADGKTIKDCSFAYPRPSNPTGIIYAFDLSGLGDNLCFRENSVTSNIISIHGLKVSLSNGADICNNIINSNILIKDSKAINFSSNHCETVEKRNENGKLSTQLKITRSIVNILDNFFEKGSEPSIKILDEDIYNDLSTITLLNNAFMYYENEGDSSSYDISIDTQVSLKIINSFRYWVIRDLIGKMYPLGLSISDKLGNPFKNYNDYSYFLSTDGCVKTNLTVNRNHSIHTGSFESIVPMENDDVVWRKAAGSYTYTYQMICDINRNIQIIPTSSIGTMKLTKKGVLFVLYGNTTFENQILLRLIRQKDRDTVSEYVDIPLCGNRMLHDNGVSVHGFMWKSYTAPVPLSNPTIPVGAVEFSGDNCSVKKCLQTYYRKLASRRYYF
ncbi:hypothetical protein Barb6_00276 [Bacteroidales bacterium Barb6]|nr:hypothetical protein Barb6_00276 [Bacteroidales bacterium Barb6]